VRDDSTAAMDASKTVKLLCAMLRDQHAVATHCLPTTDLTSLWSAIGLCALKLFADHLKRSRVTVAGAFILTNDVNSLQGALGCFNAPKVTAALEDLREVANLFLVPPANLPGLMETGRLATMGRTELREFIRQRSDFTTATGAKAAWAKELFGADDAQQVPSSSEKDSASHSIRAGGLKERLTVRLI
jgi:Exocyst complex component Sec10